jgi:hypothetical protein
VSYEAIRLWCNKFGTLYARKLRPSHKGYGDTFFLDEVFVKSMELDLESSTSTSIASISISSENNE